MTDSVNIDSETELLLDELARVSGKTRDVVLKEAVRARARAAGAEMPPRAPTDVEARKRRIMEAADRISAMPILDDRLADEIMGYDERGMPR